MSDYIESQTIDKATKIRGTAQQADHDKASSFKAFFFYSDTQCFSVTSEKTQSGKSLYQSA